MVFQHFQIKFCACTKLFSRMVWLYYTHTEKTAYYSLAPQHFVRVLTRSLLVSLVDRRSSVVSSKWRPAAAEEGFMALHIPMQPPQVHFKVAIPKPHLSFCLPYLCLFCCFGTRAAVRHAKWSVLSLRTMNFLQSPVCCPSPKINHELICRQVSFSCPIQASHAVASGDQRLGVGSCMSS